MIHKLAIGAHVVDEHDLGSSAEGKEDQVSSSSTRRRRRENSLEDILSLVGKRTGTTLYQSNLSRQVGPSRVRRAGVVGDGGVRGGDEDLELASSDDSRRAGEEEGSVTVGEDSSEGGCDGAGLVRREE